MGESSRSITKKAGAAAMERAVEALIPALFQRLDRIDERIASVDRDLHGLREEMVSRFDQVNGVMNELGQRVIRLEDRLDEIVRVIDRQNARLDRQSDKMDQWIERLVRVEMTRSAGRGKRAG